MAAAAIKSMTENTTGNKVFSAKKWFKDYNYSGLTKTAHGLVKGWVYLASKYSGTKSPAPIKYPIFLDGIFNLKYASSSLAFGNQV